MAGRLVALNWLLTDDVAAHRDEFGTPFECCDCPFGVPEISLHDEPNPADPGEGHYNCTLLGKTGREAVWGESPECTPADWRKRARAELSGYQGGNTMKIGMET